MDLRRSATHDLKKLKALLSNEATRVITQTARRKAFEIGFLTDEEIVEQCLALEKKDIDKTMTVDKNHKLWQDVYKKQCGEHLCYIKLQINEDGQGVIISFKLLESI